MSSNPVLTNGCFFVFLHSTFREVAVKCIINVIRESEHCRRMNPRPIFTTASSSMLAVIFAQNSLSIVAQTPPQRAAHLCCTSFESQRHAALSTIHHKLLFHQTRATSHSKFLRTPMPAGSARKGLFDMRNLVIFVNLRKEKGTSDSKL
jgi:hypothetical protein